MRKATDENDGVYVSATFIKDGSNIIVTYLGNENPKQEEIVEERFWRSV